MCNMEIVQSTVSQNQSIVLESELSLSSGDHGMRPEALLKTFCQKRDQKFDLFFGMVFAHFL